MKMFKKLIKILGVLVVVFVLFSIWYQYRYSMDVVEPYDVNAPNLQQKLLIATQGSAFKDTLTNNIVNSYKSASVFIKVIDVGDLENIDPDNFHALVVIHTWENWKPPATVEAFIDNHQDYKDRIVVVTTSGEGSYKIENVDAIVGESILADAPRFMEQILQRLGPLLKVNKRE